MPLPFLLGAGVEGVVSGGVQALTERALDRAVDVGVRQLGDRVLGTRETLPPGVGDLVPGVIEPESAGDEIIEELEILSTLLGSGDIDGCPICDLDPCRCP